MNEIEMLEAVQKELSKQYLKVAELQAEKEKMKCLLKECYTVVDTRMINLRGLYNTDDLDVYKRESERLKKLLTKIEEILK